MITRTTSRVMLSMLFTLSDPRHDFPLALDPLPCSVLILSMAKNQSDVENLVKNYLKQFDPSRNCHSPIRSSENAHTMTAVT